MLVTLLAVRVTNRSVVGKEEISVREVVKKAFFSWWTRIYKMQLFKEVYHEVVFVQISQFTL